MIHNSEKSFFDLLLEKDEKLKSGTLTINGQTTLEVVDCSDGKGVAIGRMGQK